VIDDLFGAALLLRDHARDDHRAGHRIGDDGGLRGFDLRERFEAAFDFAERPVIMRRPVLPSIFPRSPVRSQPCLSIEPIGTMPEARDVGMAFSSSNGPIDFGESVLLFTQMRPSFDCAGFPSGVVMRTSTPSIGLPTVVGYLPESSSATVAASVEW